MANEEKETCKHPPCSCPRAKDSDYCGAYCEGAGDTAEISCSCDHPGCA